MISRKLYQRKQNGAEFLDPQDCGSSVRWTVDMTVTEQTNEKTALKHTVSSTDCSVYMSDCSEVVSWHGYGENAVEEMERKVDRATNQLREFQRALAAAARAIKKYHTNPSKDS